MRKVIESLALEDDDEAADVDMDAEEPALPLIDAEPVKVKKDKKKRGREVLTVAPMVPSARCVHNKPSVATDASRDSDMKKVLIVSFFPFPFPFPFPFRI